MALIPGTNVGAPVVPYDTTDSYPSHRALYGQGGLRTMASTADRNAIPNARLEEGCEVYVIADNTTYRLKAGYSNPTVDADWEIAVGPGGGGTVLGTGAANLVAYWTGASAISSDPNFKFRASAHEYLTVDPTITLTGGSANIAVTGSLFTTTAAVDLASSIIGVRGIGTHQGIGSVGETYGGQFLSGVSGGGTVNAAYGINVSSFITNASVVNSSHIAGLFFVEVADGSTSSFNDGIRVSTVVNTGSTVGTNRGIRIDTSGIGGGSVVGNAYGLSIGNITGATNNWAIQTEGGLVEFADDLRNHGDTAFGSTGGFGPLGMENWHFSTNELIQNFAAYNDYQVIRNQVTLAPADDPSGTQIFHQRNTMSANSSGDHFGALYGLGQNVFVTGSGPVDGSTAGHFAAYFTGSGTNSLVRGLRAEANSQSSGAAGATTVSIGLDIATSAGNGAVVNSNFGATIGTPNVFGGGSIATINCGLYVYDQNVGAANNYSIYTNNGLVRFGDDVIGIARTAFGSTAVLGIDGSGIDHLWDFRETVTDLTASNYWVFNSTYVTVIPTTDSTARFLAGNGSGVVVDPTSTQPIGTVHGGSLAVQNSGTGLIGISVGGSLSSINTGAGNITNNAGANIIGGNAGTGTIAANIGAAIQSGVSNAAGTNTVDISLYIITPNHSGTMGEHYGLRISDQNFGSKAWAIYSEGGASYHQGFLGLNVITANSQLDVQGGVTLKETKTGVNYTILTTDQLILASSGITLTLPSSASAGKGLWYRIKNADCAASTGAITIQTAGGGDVLVSTTTSATTYLITTDGGACELHNDGEGHWYVY